ncbi:MAG TPA: putative Ig domain-containing protein [Acidimicrobiales bacterium]
MVFRKLACVMTASVVVLGIIALGAAATPAGAATSTAWSIMASPNSGTTQRNNLNGVSCTSATTCTAVGFRFASTSNYQTLIERWNGSTWSIVASPNTSTTKDNLLRSVSCTSATACTAVGDYDSGTNYQTLVERWNGSTWSIVASPNTSTTQDNVLQSVSCTSATACTVVGNYSNASGPQTLAEQWNGTTWSIVTSPNTTTTQNNYLYGVSCTSATACTAVGDYYSGSAFQTLVERWNGSTWSIVASPNTSTTVDNILSSVSCTSATACTAVGHSSLTSGYIQTLVAQWSGTTWSIATSPSTSTTQDNDLLGVACTSATACAAVGYATTGTSLRQTLTEVWNGTTWSIVASPNSSTTQNNFLIGASCTSVTACTGVGSFYNSSFTPQTLVATTLAAPTITSAASTTFTEGSPGSFTVTALGNPNPTTFTATGAPNGVVFNTATGVLSGTPTQAGIFSLTITASNGIGTAATQDFTLGVRGLQVSTVALPAATRGSPYSFQLKASGGVTPYTWKKAGALPTGLTLSLTGVLSGTPSTALAARTFSIAVSVSDSTPGGRQTVTAVLTLTLH